jgi:hypothetical protein
MIKIIILNGISFKEYLVRVILIFLTNILLLYYIHDLELLVYYNSIILSRVTRAKKYFRLTKYYDGLIRL